MCLQQDLYKDVSCIMITYPDSSNFEKKIFSNFIDFTICHRSEAATGGFLLEKVFLEISQNSQENTCNKVSFLNKVAGWGDCFWSFSCLLLKICLFHFSRKMNEKREIPWRSPNIYFFAGVSICLTSKISKEIWQIVIWWEIVFKENLILQFSWLEEFRNGKVSGW